MQKKFNLKDLPYKEIELELPKWLLESKDGAQVLLDCGRDKTLKALVLKEVERLELKSIEWHYNPGLIIVVF
jgi:hypothetical protein